MITKKTRLMSAFAALLMLVSMFAMIVLPASAATYFDEVVSATGLQDASAYPDFATYTPAASSRIWKITNRAGLEKMAEMVFAGTNLAGYTFIQAADIDMGWVPFEGIGGRKTELVDKTETNTNKWRFAGTYDGNGFVIENLYIPRHNIIQGGGLFGSPTGATIKNVGIASGLILGADETGSICGEAYGTTIANCWNAATIFGGGTNGTAGIAGKATGASKIYNCYNLGVVYSFQGHAGGMTGWINSASFELYNSYNAGQIIAGLKTVSGTDGNLFGYNAMYRGDLGRTDVGYSATEDKSLTGNNYYVEGTGQESIQYFIDNVAGTEGMYDKTITANDRATRVTAAALTASDATGLAALLNTGDLTKGAPEGYTLRFENSTAGYPVLTYVKDGAVAVKRTAHTSDNVLNADKLINNSAIFKKLYENRNGGFVGMDTGMITDENGLIEIGNANELFALGVATAWGNRYNVKSIKLTADIDCATMDIVPTDYMITLGANGTIAAGMEGQNHIIKNWKTYEFIANGNAKPGLFAQIDASTVANVGLVKPHMTIDAISGTRSDFYGYGSFFAGTTGSGVNFSNTFVSGGRVDFVVAEKADYNNMSGYVGRYWDAKNTYTNCWVDADAYIAGEWVRDLRTVGSSSADISATDFSTTLYAAKEVSYGSSGDLNNKNCEAQPYADVSAADGSMAAALNKKGIPGNWTTVDGYTTWGTAANATREITIELSTGANIIDTLHYYVNSGDSFTLPTVPNYEVDETSLPAGVSEGAFTVTEDVTITYLTSGVDLTLLTDLMDKYSKLDLDLFVNADKIQELISTLEEGYNYYTGSGEFAEDGAPDLTDPATIDEFNAEYEEWMDADSKIDYTMVDTYPNYPKYSEYALYAEWNTTNNWAIADKADWLALVDASKSSTMKGNTIHLLNDVDFGGTQMQPVGYTSASSSKAFDGTFDGHGYVFENINISETMNTTPVGVFAIVGGTGVVKNFGVASGSVTAVYTNSDDGIGIGGVAGQGNSGALFNSVWNGANVSATTSGSGNRNLSIAGIVGRGHGTTTLNGCYNIGKITGISHAAALNDWGQNSAYLFNSFGAGILIGGYTGMIRFNTGTNAELAGGSSDQVSNSWAVGMHFHSENAAAIDEAMANYLLAADAYETGEAGYLINQNYVSGMGDRVYFTIVDGKTVHGTAATQTRKITLTADGEDDIVFYAAAGSTVTLDQVIGATYSIAAGSEGTVNGDQLTVPNADVTVTYEISGYNYVDLKAALEAWDGVNTDYFVNGDVTAALIASASAKMAAQSYESQDAIDADVSALNSARVYNAAPNLPTTSEMADYPDAPGYMINSEADYIALSQSVTLATADKTVYLGKNITMTAASTGKTLNSLAARFDGLDHSITGLKIDNNLFGESAKLPYIGNVTFIDCHATAATHNDAFLMSVSSVNGQVLENLTFTNCSATKGNGSNGLSLMVGQYTGSSLLYKNIVIEGCTLNRSYGTGHAGNCGFMGGTHSGTVTVDGAILRNNIVTGAVSPWGWGVAFGELTGTNTLNNIGIFGTTEVDGCGYIANGLVVGQFKNGTMTADNVLAYHDDAASPATNNVFKGDHVEDATKFTSSTNVYNDGNLAEKAYKANKAGVSKTWIFEAGATYPTFGTEGLPVKVSFVVGEETYNFYTDVTGAMINADPELATAYDWDKEIAAVHTEDTVYTARLTTCEHVWSDWTTVDGVHTRTCTLGCGETESGNCDGTFAHDAESDPSTHSKKCSVCENVVTENCVFTETVTPATHTAGGFTTYTCSCNYSYTGNETESLGHTWGDWVANDDGTHTRKCTDNDGGEETGDCDYDVVVTAPTCCAAGYTTKTCKVCEDVIVIAGDPATNEHVWSEWTVETPATTTTPGVEKRVCTNDGCTAFETRKTNILSDIALAVKGVEDAKAGDTVTVTVGVTGNTGFAGATVEIAYAEGLTPVSTASSGTFSIFSGITPETDFANNKFRASFVNLTNVATDCDIFTITFKVADDAEAGDYAIDVTVVEAVYETEELIDLAGASGKVTVVEDAPEILLGDTNNDGKTTSSDVVTLMMVVNGATVANYNELNADVNKDGKITSSDVVALMMLINT